jgi:alanine racemase
VILLDHGGAFRKGAAIDILVPKSPCVGSLVSENTEIFDRDVACLTVRLGAIVENWRVCATLASGAETTGVVKADAYGLGMAPVAQSLAAAGCRTYFVARLSEGVRLRAILPEGRIFVLDGAEEANASALISHRLIPVLNSMPQIVAWQEAAHRRRTTLDAAIHIDTGMNRLGLPPDELAVLSGVATKRLAGLNVALIMSHLACADDPSSPMNAVQRGRFRAALTCLPNAAASLSSSGGILLGRDYIFDMVRPGLALYGGNPQPRSPNPFRPAAVLTGRILQLRRVDKEESVGYGANFRAERPSTLATIALGYADGLMRAIGNRGTGAIAGKRVPIVGRVSMDLVTLDITDIVSAGVKVGTQVEFLGDTISLEELASAANTASYEILTSLGSRLERRYTEAP